MDGIILIGLLSGLVFGALAMSVRPFASAVILAPVILAPLVYIFIWRDALAVQCLFANSFNTDGCVRTRALFTDMLDHTGEALLVGTVHIVTAVGLVMALGTFKRIMSERPKQKQARQTQTRQSQAAQSQAAQDQASYIQAQQTRAAQALQAKMAMAAGQSAPAAAAEPTSP